MSTCNTCKHFAKLEGECRIRAPRIARLDTQFPKALAKCGEHDPIKPDHTASELDQAWGQGHSEGMADANRISAPVISELQRQVKAGQGAQAELAKMLTEAKA
jgi:hypothetical protein